MMSNNVWDQFRNSFDDEEMQKEIDAAASNKFEDVPAGTYRVEVDKMGPKVSKSGNPMVFIQFNILKGKYKKQKIFYNQVVHTGYGIMLNNDFLTSMDLDIVEDTLSAGGKLYRNMPQYAQLIMDAAEEIDDAGLTFDLQYSEGKNGFHNYKILEVYEG